MIQPGNYVRDLLKGVPGEAVHAQGWVKTRRDGKSVHFIQLNDGSSPTDLQVVVEAGAVPPEVIARITTGACLSVEGELVASPGKGQAVELKARNLTVHGAADPEEYPLQKKKHNLETLRPLGHLRARTNTFAAVFRVRNALGRAIHKFFQERGFIYVHAPVISASDAEGAGSMFTVTALDVGKPAGFEQDFFGRHTYLTVSGQLEAEIFALAFANVYTFGPTFRAENSNTPRHLAEFCMIEPEMAFCDLKDNQDLAEAFLKSQVEQVLDDCRPDLEFLAKWYEPDLFKTPRDAGGRSLRAHHLHRSRRAVAEGRPSDWEFPVAWGSDLQSEHERYLTEELFNKPVIVTDYPKEIKAFYMRSNDDGKTVARHGRAGAAHRRDHRRQPARRAPRRAARQDPRAGGPGRGRAYWWYLDLRRFGGVEHAGFGMGFERMMMYLTGMKNIRDVIPFPRHAGQCEF